MKSQYLQLALLFLVGVVFMGGCAQFKTFEKKPSHGVSSQQPIHPSPQPSILLEEGKKIKPPASVEENPFIHKVRWPGETLNRISWWYTGTGRNWQEIVKANQSLDPRRIMIGDEIIIPRDLLARQEPMTREYRTPAAVRKELEEIEATTQAAAPQTVDLFGPIDSAEQDVPPENAGGMLPLESLE